MMNHPIWKVFTSLRLTVACLAAGIVIIFCGKWAQVDDGLWNAQTRWFRSFIVWWHHVPIFPGGYLVGSLLLLNLIAAHVKRFTWAPKKIGIQLTHLGVIVLLLGGLFTDLLSHESLLSLNVGQTKLYSESGRDNELVFATDAAPGQERVVSIPQRRLRPGKELAVPQLPFTVRVQSFAPNSLVVSRAGALQAQTQLTTAMAALTGEFSTPAGLAALAERDAENEARVRVWRAALLAVGEKENNDTTAAAARVAADSGARTELCEELKTRFRTQMLAGFTARGGAMGFAAAQAAKGGVTTEALPAASSAGVGKEAAAFPEPELTEMDSVNYPFTVLELSEGGNSLGTWLFSPYLDAQPITARGVTWRVALRFERTYHDFTTTLLNVTHDVYPGTRTAANQFQGIPKNFQSRVRIANPATGEEREVDIFMNNPLRYAGLTFYQFQMGPGQGGGDSSTFQVVRNPTWVAPYLGCILVGLGMLVQFSYHLLGFIRKRSRPVAPPALPRTPAPARELVV